RFSVVVPTHERRGTIARHVAALDRQSLRDFEAIVVVDGSADGSAEALRALDVSFPLTVIEQENQGVARARTAGAAAAEGEILLFVDDDMEADPQMLAEHDASHREGFDFVLGDLPLHPDSPPNLLSWGVGYWANSRRERLEAAGNELGLDDLLTGQMSVSRKAFDAVGGFDASFTRDGLVPSGDIDFGYRILKAGFRATFNPAAISHQYYDVDPGDYLRRAHDIGASEQELVIKHPEQAKKLEAAPAFHTRRSRWPFGPLVVAPRGLVQPLLDAVAGLVRSGRQGERLRRLFFAMRTLEYQRGAREARRKLAAGSAVVLAYHAVDELDRDDPLREYAVPARALAAQLDDLARRGWKFVGLGTLLRALAGEERLPPKAAILTFDDAYANVLETGLPVLEQRGVPAVVFAVAGATGGVNEWRREGAKEMRLLDAEGLREVSRRGIEVGSHCMTHRQLPKVPAAELEEELKGSADALEALGLPRPRALAYPHGEWSHEIAAAAFAAGYEAAFSVEPGRAERAANRYALPRIEVLASDTPLTVRAKIATVGWPQGVRNRLLRYLGTRR
ncbi:MAG TPA: polysaccharide deacetylase family protein, partial [Solirubrobacterales bacterium]|nr:polysaccharide deacetylase family protein [Solirubrobacterales bacterium]